MSIKKISLMLSAVGLIINTFSLIIAIRRYRSQQHEA
jgi:hypothetical protein